MSPSNLIRLGGLAAVLAGVLFIIYDLLSLGFASADLSEVAATGSYALYEGLHLIGGVLLLGGLVGLYAGQSFSAGTLGVVAFLVAFVGTALVVGVIWALAFVAPSVAATAPGLLNGPPAGALGVGFTLSFVLGGLGWLLFGVATLRARVYPRAAAVLLIVGAVLTFIPVPLSALVWEAAIAWLGFSLLTERGVTAEPSTGVHWIAKKASGTR
jgi:hypothetical protein